LHFRPTVQGHEKIPAMKSASRQTGPLPSPRRLPRLRHGDHLKQPEFHRRYLQYPDHVKIELIGGIVYVSSPQRRRHSRYQSLLSGIVGIYEYETPGLELLVNPTTILGEESEPQPDLEVRILSDFLGQSRETENDYVEGSPELMMEISRSTRALDLRHKKNDYERAGVCEYLVVDLEEQKLHWFNFRGGKPILPTKQGIYRSQVFPGLWIHGPALFAEDRKRLTLVIRRGIRSREHAAFVKRLKAAQRRHP
jgi:Uma2 family endonuclease